MSVPAHAAAQGELLPGGGVLHVQGTLLQVQGDSLATRGMKDSDYILNSASVDYILYLVSVFHSPLAPLDTAAAPPWGCWRPAGSRHGTRCRSGWCRSRRRLRPSSSSDTCTPGSQCRAWGTSGPANITSLFPAHPFPLVKLLPTWLTSLQPPHTSSSGLKVSPPPASRSHLASPPK